MSRSTRMKELRHMVPPAIKDKTRCFRFIYIIELLIDAWWVEKSTFSFS